MKLICAWCNSVIADKGPESSAISHGICDSCASSMMSEPKGLIRTFLDQLEYPVILIDSNSQMQLENKQFKDLVGKQTAEIVGKKAGEIFSCIHWRESGSCGSTPYCKNCIINKTVGETFRTGESILDLEASLITSDGDHESTLTTHISTQKVDDYVMMILN